MAPGSRKPGWGIAGRRNAGRVRSTLRTGARLIRVSAPSLGGRESEYVSLAMQSGWISSRGPFVERFERAFAEFCGARYALACSSGTTALHLALAARDIGPADEVLVPAFTMAATAFAVQYTGATPVVVDADPGTWCVEPGKMKGVGKAAGTRAQGHGGMGGVAQAVSGRTKAVVVTHIYGHPADVDAVRAAAAGAAPGCVIIEDAAEAHGAVCRGRRAGSLGDAAAFSFYANKILTTGEGGMVTTSDPDLAERCRSLRDHAFGGDEARYQHDRVGFSYRMTNLQAAVGLAQVERAEELVERSRAVGRRYVEGLCDVPGLVLPVERDWAKNVYWVFGVLVGDEFGGAPGRSAVEAAVGRESEITGESGQAAARRDWVRSELSKRGVETRAFFHPIHLQPAFRRLGFFEGVRCPVAEDLGARGLYLPSGPGQREEDIERVIAAVRELAA